MPTLITSPKSGNKWTVYDLTAFDISIERSDDEKFFGYKIDTVNIDDYSPSLRTSEPNQKDPDAYILLEYMDDVMWFCERDKGAVADYVGQLFHCIGYTDRDHRTYPNRSLRLSMCGRKVHATTDVCIKNEKKEILFLLQEDRPYSDPEPQLIAQAIAAFQQNNNIREQDKLPPLDEYTFPCIIMLGTCPTFYKIKVTKDLDDAVRSGTYPQYPTIVSSFTPVTGRLRRKEGMRDRSGRERILKAFKAFRPLMKF